VFPQKVPGEDISLPPSSLQEKNQKTTTIKHCFYIHVPFFLCVSGCPFISLKRTTPWLEGILKNFYDHVLIPILIVSANIPFPNNATLRF
jgi:coproporphyrinogen III oxidase-like Fe-S oxidoreductase